MYEGKVLFLEDKDFYQEIYLELKFMKEKVRQKVYEADIVIYKDKILKNRYALGVSIYPKERLNSFPNDHEAFQYARCQLFPEGIPNGKGSVTVYIKGVRYRIRRTAKYTRNLSMYPVQGKKNANY